MKALSIDLRERVIASVDNGTHIDEAVKMFKVGRRTIYEWLELRKKTGSLKAKTGFQKGHSHQIKDWDQFRVFAHANQQCSAPQLVVKWKNLTGNQVSENVILRGLKKVGFTSKKKLFNISKQIKQKDHNF